MNLADDLEAVILKQLDLNRGSFMSNQELASSIRYQVAQVIQKHISFGRTENLPKT